CPPGLTDSKLLTASAREALVPLARSWCLAWAVGHAGPAEIDAHGIVGALRLAGRRALAQVRRTVGDVDAVLLDGKHDWLSRPSACSRRSTSAPTTARRSPTRACAPSSRRTCSARRSRPRASWPRPSATAS